MTVVSAALMPAVSGAAPWTLKPDIQLPDDGLTAQKVELVDIDGDGWVDIAFANSRGEGVSNPGPGNAELNTLLINDAGAGFTALATAFEETDNAWTIRAGDVDNDGDADLVVGDNGTGSMSYVLINEGNKTFTREDIPLSANQFIGDLELGDVDGDGNLDVLATEWGPLPHGQIDDPGGRILLWLGNGDGTFSDGKAKLSMGSDVLAAWSFDLDLFDLNNDYALDAVITTRGDADAAVVLLNDGGGNLNPHPVPVLQPMISKNINVGVTPMDFDGDGYLDLITLQDGGLGMCVGDPPICARRNSVLINDKAEQFTIPMNFWLPQFNPGKIDFDAATLDFNNDGKPDFVIAGLQIGPNDKNARLILNDGVAFTPAPVPMDAAFPLVPELAHTTNLMFADFDHDRREDVAVAQRDPDLLNYALFGRDDPADGVAEDITPPRIYDDGVGQKLGDLLYFGQEAGFMARVNDYKTPTHWHDFLYDPALGDLNLIGDGAALLAHGRRLPYMEFAFSLANPDDIKAMPDNDPAKFIAPSIWFGESLWRVNFTVPYNGKNPDTLTWQYCAIDAANNKSCVGPFQAMVLAPDSCGDGVVDPWEECDDDADPTCVMCVETCGDGVCELPETFENCPEDCLCGNGVCDPGETQENCIEDCGPGTESDTGPVCGDMVCEDPETPENCAEDCLCNHNGVCEPPENNENCPDDCMCDDICDPTGGDSCPTDCPVCGDGVCDPGEVCPEDCDMTTTGEGICPDGAAAGPDGQCELDDDGCGCVADPKDSRGLWASLLLLGVFGVRRSRKRA